MVVQKIITISGGLTSAYVAKLVLDSDKNAELEIGRASCRERV